jgi:hypothetical protein
MTEAEWLAGTDLAAHVRFASERLSPRRQRLLAVAFCRAAAHLFNEPELDEALVGIDHFADDIATPGAVERVRQRCRDIAQQSYELYRTSVDRGVTDGLEDYVRSELAWSVSYATNNPVPVAEVGAKVATTLAQALTKTVVLVPVASAAYDAAIAEQMCVMRSVVWEVTGNPFRSAAFSAEWRTDTAVAIARQVYESREFSAMPILADALQDAGCDNDDVLNHCRDTSLGHVRGCWVVDGVLGKE